MDPGKGQQWLLRSFGEKWMGNFTARRWGWQHLSPLINLITNNVKSPRMSNSANCNRPICERFCPPKSNLNRILLLALITHLRKVRAREESAIATLWSCRQQNPESGKLQDTDTGFAANKVQEKRRGRRNLSIKKGKIRHRRSYIIWFLLYSASRIGKSIETERLPGPGEGRNGE